MSSENQNQSTIESTDYYWVIIFSCLSGKTKEKHYKTFSRAKKTYEKYINNMGFWYNISLVKRKYDESSDKD